MTADLGSNSLIIIAEPEVQQAYEQLIQFLDKLLVDDNAEVTLESVSEVPFTSVHASQTVATTSFAGFAKAGTTITVTPTISEAKHVSLDYLVTLNSFLADNRRYIQLRCCLGERLPSGIV